MTLKQSPFSKAYRELVRQAQLLTRSGVVKTWRTWDGAPVSDDPPASGACPWVRLTMAGITGERQSVYDSGSDFVGRYRMAIDVEIVGAGYAPEAVVDVWGEIREALFSDADAARQARDAAFEAAGVVDLIEEAPVSPGGAQDFAGGLVAGSGRIVLVIDAGV